MIALVKAIGAFGKEKLDGISLEDRGGKTEAPVFNLYIGQIYHHRQEPRKEEFPFVLVRLINRVDEDVEDDSTYSVASVRIVIGIWNDGEHAEGYHDLLNCLSRLVDNLLEFPVLGKKYELCGKLEVATFEGPSEPFWLGDIVASWKIRRSIRIEE